MRRRIALVLLIAAISGAPHAVAQDAQSGDQTVSGQGSWPERMLSSVRLLNARDSFFERFRSGRKSDVSVTRRSLSNVRSSFQLSLDGNAPDAMRSFGSGETFRVLVQNLSGVSFVWGSSATDQKTGDFPAKTGTDMRAGMHWQDGSSSGFYGLEIDRRDLGDPNADTVRGLMRLEFRF